MSDFISREEVLKKLNYEMKHGAVIDLCGLDTAYDVIENMPSAEPEERTAKVTHKPEAFFYRCECGYGLCCEKNDMNFCPHCGAKLVWEYDNGNE